MHERRSFLQLLAISTLTVGAAWATQGCATAILGGNDDPPPDPGDDDSNNGPPVGNPVGKATDFSGNGLHLITATQYIVGRDDDGLYAFSALCTCPDGACNLTSSGVVDADGITCSCHGSVYDNKGAVVQGPATKPLESLAIAQAQDGTLFVNPDKTVPSTKRLAI
jgi:Rieske Fe-S protein